MFSLMPPEERCLSLAELRDYRTTSVKTWIGGYRNRPQAWTEPRNWYPVGVPSWRDRVTVGGYSRHRCTVPTGVDPIAALTILPGATLIVDEKACLKVDGKYADPLGVLGASGVINDGCLHVKGEFAIRHATHGGITNNGLLINRGCVSVDQSVTDCLLRWGHMTDLGRLERTVV